MGKGVFILPYHSINLKIKPRFVGSNIVQEKKKNEKSSSILEGILKEVREWKEIGKTFSLAFSNVRPEKSAIFT